MALRGYQRFWINDIQTSGFFKALAQIEVPYLIPELCGRKSYDEMRRWAEAKLGHTEFQVVHADYVDVECLHDHVVLAMNYPWAFLKRQNADKELPNLLEGYLCFSGGNYKGAGYKGNNTKGGVSQAGFYRNVYRVKELLAEWDDSPRITALDYRKVLAQCGPGDMVYL